MYMKTRPYNPLDYPHIKKLYETPGTFGGQFDEARDTQERLDTLADSKPGSILVAEEGDEIIGTVTIFEDGRECWLYRFAVLAEHDEATKVLYHAAVATCRDWGHEQLLVYAPAGNQMFEERYARLGLNKGNDYTVYWVDIT